MRFIARPGRPGRRCSCHAAACSDAGEKTYPTSARPVGVVEDLDGRRLIWDVQRLRAPSRRAERLANTGCVSRPSERLKHVQASPTRKPPITSLGQWAPT
jgi:hypothetical protein